MPPATRRATQANMPGSLAAYGAFVVDRTTCPRDPCAAAPEIRIEDGALMEPNERNRWQPVANGEAPKTAHIGGSATGDGMI